ncbi:MAG: phosphoglucosamine mutase [Defluviitaleaceae bacterium]|nr:phosphoglucosamine mutase [Defluviitaleaceae bacterium]MCL2835906.1 phosphoglucosamine mutase [Defluviitaleaceae bacterium]
MTRLFGTDGVRGVANTELTPELAFSLGCGLARCISQGQKRVGILIGMDTRRSGHMLEAALTAGILSAGGDVYAAGVVPTPAVAYLTKKYGLGAGVVISASHNPFLDNGIKIFDSNGYKMSDEAERDIEDAANEVRNGKGMSGRPVGGGIGIRHDAGYALRDYIVHMKSVVGELDFGGVKVALDCANGSMYQAAPALFTELGAEAFVMADKPSGENINLRCGSTHIEVLAKRTLESGSGAGFAFDGDGDRCLAVDENGKVVDGDQILSVLALFYKNKGVLKKNTVVSTVMSNIGFEVMCGENGLNIEKTAVGDKHVFKCMLENGYMLGGEQSGHVINLNYSTTGDGLCTALQLVVVMKETGKKLSELASAMERYPQVLRNVRVSNERKSGYLTSSEIMDAIGALEKRLEGRGRVLVRPSGTEPLIRVMLEGRDMPEITREAEALAALIEDVLS